MSLPPIPDNAIRVHASADSWRGALRLVGGALEEAGATTAAYTSAMIAMVETHGPYIVIAPGLALAHARPDSSVRADGLAVVTLAAPVAFGHPHNDPVRVVLGLAVADVAGHLETVGAIANLFDDPDAVDRIADATNEAEIRSAMGVCEP